MRHECIICGRTLGRGVDLLLVTRISRHRGHTFVCSVCRQYLVDNFYDKTAAEPPTADGSDVAAPAPDDLAQMQAALAAEGYAWVHPLDGSPKRLERASRPADDVRAILEGAARGRLATTLMGEAGPEAVMPLESGPEAPLDVTDDIFPHDALNALVDAAILLGQKMPQAEVWAVALQLEKVQALATDAIRRAYRGG